ncbi:MAG: hypothetical protein K9W42_05225 [Candidatus Heimdallarchaeota archaeon]|nr:hypothetical protein [Candidatus Heimdallarchaeota archaeon]
MVNLSPKTLIFSIILVFVSSVPMVVLGIYYLTRDRSSLWGYVFLFIGLIILAIMIILLFQLSTSTRFAGEVLEEELTEE